jgi:hypothetical protein
MLNPGPNFFNEGDKKFVRFTVAALMDMHV